MTPIIKKAVKKKKPIHKNFRFLFVFTLFLLVVLLSFDAYSFFFKSNGRFGCNLQNNVAVINVQGTIVTFDENNDGKTIASSEDIVRTIEDLNADEAIKAIVVNIDSLGGLPVAGEEIANALKRSPKLTVAVIRANGDSAAYIAATGAKRIFASSFSEVGNIGITMSYLDYSKQAVSQGVVYQQISSGKFKDMANPNKELTKEEKKALQDYVNQLYQVFVDTVSVNRNIEVNKVQEAADGSIFTAEEAKTRGLIDEIGGMQEARSYIKKELKIEPNSCYIR